MNKGQSQHWRCEQAGKAALSKAFGNIRGRQDTPPPPYLFCRAIMEAVAQDGGSFEAKCDGTFLGFD